MFSHTLLELIYGISACTRIDFPRTSAIRFVSRDPSRTISRRPNRVLLRPYRTFKPTTITVWGKYFCEVLPRIRDSRFDHAECINWIAKHCSFRLQFCVTSFRRCCFDSHLSENAIKRINPLPPSPHIPDL